MYRDPRGRISGPQHVPAAEGGGGHVGPLHAVPRCRGCRTTDRAIRDTLAFYSVLRAESRPSRGVRGRVETRVLEEAPGGRGPDSEARRGAPGSPQILGGGLVFVPVRPSDCWKYDVAHALVQAVPLSPAGSGSSGRGSGSGGRVAIAGGFPDPLVEAESGVSRVTPGTGGRSRRIDPCGEGGRATSQPLANGGPGMRLYGRALARPRGARLRPSDLPGAAWRWPPGSRQASPHGRGYCGLRPAGFRPGHT